MPCVALCGWTLAPGMAPMGRSICSNYFSELERSSRLELTWADGVWLAGCPQVKRALTTRCGGCRSVSGGRVRGGLASGSSGGRPRRWRG